MRYNTLEIRWHDTKPIFSCDFQPFEATTPKKQANPYQKSADNAIANEGKLWRLATAGGDNNVRIWLATPNPPATSVFSSGHNSGRSGTAVVNSAGSSSTSSVYGKPKVEYLATLDKHNLTVNVVRFSPSGHILATAGDDSGTGGVLLWRLSNNATTSTFGGNSEDAAYERESWMAIKLIKTKSPEIYDIAWSPDGQYLLTGGTDATARIYRVSDGACVAEMTDHKDWVQGVAWDPLNAYVATQSKDRTLCVYALTHFETQLGVHLVSKSSKLTSETSVTVVASDQNSAKDTTTMDLTESSPLAPPLATTTVSTSQLLFGDEETTPFFRRLAFATDGSLLVTPAGIFHDPQSNTSSKRKGKLTVSADTHSPSSAQKGSLSAREGNSLPASVNGKSKKFASGPSPTAYLFARGQLGNETPIANLPGHKTTSIVVKFNPVLWNLRKKRSTGSDAEASLDKGKSRATESENIGGNGTQAKDEDVMDVDVPTRAGEPTETAPTAPLQSSTVHLPTAAVSANEDPFLGTPDSSIPSASSKPALFELKQRTIYAVATHETILIYDTQQSSPICLFGSLHFAAFTDLAWTADGLTLIATSSDGYASIFTFEEGELGVPCDVQPERKLSPWEESTAAFSSPVKPVPFKSSLGTSSMSTALPTTSASSPFAIPSSPAVALQKNGTDSVPVISSSPLKREDSDVILVEEPSEPKKEKKRAALQHLGPLSR